MTDAPTKSRRTLDDVDHHKVMTALYAHLKRVDGETVSYETGWSDQAIADECGVTLNNVTGLRSRAFGKLAKGGEIATDPRVDELIRRHNAFVNFHFDGDVDSKDRTPFLMGEKS